MAGHSQFKNIMHRKGAHDKKRAKVFTKIIRELTTAARTGLPDPAANPRLRAAVLVARLAWRPKTAINVEGDVAQALFKLLEALEDSDDVQNVFANFEVADDVMARLSA